MASHGTNFAIKIWNYLAPSGTFGKLFVGMMKMFGLETKGASLVKLF
jgi:hypothetical protein